MAIKASNTITLASVTDVDSITPYYLLQTATLSPPSKPTSNPPPSSWVSTEPQFDYSKTLYTTMLIVYSNGAWEYSDVSTVSEYEASKAAYNKAQSAEQQAQATSQYFWMGTGAELGAHITEVPQEQWSDQTHQNYHSGGNLLAESNSIAIRNGTTVLATFGSSGAVIGKINETRALLDRQSLTLIDDEENAYFDVGDMRDQDGLVTQYFKDGSVTCHLMAPATDTNYEIWVDDELVGRDILLPYLEKTIYRFVLYGVPGASYTVKAIYEPADGELFKTYTLGITSSINKGILSVREGYGTMARGAYSHAEGYNTIADEACAHAEGSETSAYGNSAHAEGYSTYADGKGAHAEGYDTIANGEGAHAEGYGTIAYGHQTAMGKYNERDLADNYALIIGNGEQGNPSNALTVGWNGNVDASGTVLGKLKRVGAITGEAPSTEPTIATGASWRNLQTITLTKGVWMVTIGAEFAGNSTGIRAITLATGSSGSTSAGTVIRTIRAAAASTGLTTLQATFPVDVTASSQVFYLNAFQTSGSTLTVKPRHTAVQIGNSTST